MQDGGGGTGVAVQAVASQCGDGGLGEAEGEVEMGATGARSVRAGDVR